MWGLPFSAALKKSYWEPNLTICTGPAPPAFQKAVIVHSLFHSASDLPPGNQYLFQWTELKLREWSLLFLELQRQKMFESYKFGLEDEKLLYPHHPLEAAKVQIYTLIIWKNIFFTIARAPPFSKQWVLSTELTSLAAPSAARHPITVHLMHRTHSMSWISPRCSIQTEYKLVVTTSQLGNKVSNQLGRVMKQSCHWEEWM